MEIWTKFKSWFAEDPEISDESRALANFGKLKAIPDGVEEVENWYVGIRERYKHDRTRLAEIERDWLDYSEMLLAREKAWDRIYLAEDERIHRRTIELADIRLSEIHNRMKMTFEAILTE